jgi:uncharacterized pyridoxal phosphate-containing UPF0001 family protein
VAVSKLKPANDILALHRGPARHLHFGENYAQELARKAELLPRSVRWHFIGGLQSTHCKALARIPNLFAVSSVDTAKKARLLDGARADLVASWAAAGTATAGGSSSSSTGGGENDSDSDIGNDNDNSPPSPRIGVHVQVNTSGEATKSGCAPGADVVALCRFVLAECPHLRLLGLMTIGAIARSAAAGPGAENEDFLLLREQRDLVERELGALLGEREGAAGLELSMGMSEDFECAVELGSGEVRVGSTIFGTRGPKSEAKILV